MTREKSTGTTATQSHGRSTEEKKSAFVPAPDADYLEGLARLDRQTGGNALLRLSQIIGDKKRGLPALLPVGKTSFYKNLKAGVYPFTPVRLGPKTVAFYYREVMKFIEDAGAKTTTEKGGRS